MSDQTIDEPVTPSKAGANLPATKTPLGDEPPGAGAKVPVEGAVNFGVQYKTHYFEIEAHLPAQTGQPWIFKLSEGKDSATKTDIADVQVKGKAWSAYVHAPDDLLKFGKDGTFAIPVLTLGVAQGLPLPNQNKPALPEGGGEK